MKFEDSGFKGLRVGTCPTVEHLLVPEEVKRRCLLHFQAVPGQPDRGGVLVPIHPDEPHVRVLLSKALVLALKRFARYLVGKPRLMWFYKWQTSIYIDVYSDTDWAGCVKTR